MKQCLWIHITVALSIVTIGIGVTMCSPLSAQPADMGAVVLKDAATVYGNEIYMRDLVDAEAEHTMNSRDMQSLLAVSVGKAPQPGKSRYLSRAYIVMKLKNKHVDVQELCFDGAQSVHVVREASVLPRIEIERAVHAYLIDQYGIDGAHSFVESENLPEELTLPQGAISFRIEERPAGFKNGKFSFQLYVYANGTLYKKKLVSVNVLERRTVVVAARPVRIHETIEAESIMMKEMTIENGANYCMDGNEVIGKMATMVIQPGVPIKTNQVKEMPIIKKGDVVSARFTEKNMHLVLKVRALEDGTKGALIPIYNASTKKRLSGKVISSDTVEVVL